MIHPLARAPHMDALSQTFLLILKKWCLIKQFSLVVKQYPRPVNQVLTRIWRPGRTELAGLSEGYSMS